MASPASLDLRCANTAERIEVLIGMDILGDPGNVALDERTDFPRGSDAAFDE